MAAICSEAVMWVTTSGLLFLSRVWSYREPTRTIKNSSILLPKIAANFRRSPSGTFFSLASASTRLSKSSQLNSRLMKILSDFCFSKSCSSLLFCARGFLRADCGQPRPAFGHARRYSLHFIQFFQRSKGAVFFPVGKDGGRVGRPDPRQFSQRFGVSGVDVDRPGSIVRLCGFVLRGGGRLVRRCRVPKLPDRCDQKQSAPQDYAGSRNHRSGQKAVYATPAFLHDKDSISDFML